MFHVNAEPDEDEITRARKSTRCRRAFFAVLAARFTAAFASLLFLSLPFTTEAAMKEVTTDKGVISIPVAPQRVVANYSTDLDYALVLGLPVVGGGPLRGEIGFPFAVHQRAYDLKGITPIAIFPQINFESLVSLKPDVIIANYTMEPNGYELLSAIAPTIWLNPDNNGGWRGLLRRYGDAFGRSDLAEAFIADYERRKDEVRKRLPRGLKVALVNNFGDGTFVLMQANQLGVLYKDLGFRPSAHVPATYPDRQPFSEERIDLLKDADILFLWRNIRPDGTRDTQAYDRMQSIPGWDELPAVKAGQVHDFPVELFYTSPLTDRAVLDLVDDLFKAK
jgi:iron complex transport system substrate-binding protein